MRDFPHYLQSGLKDCGPTCLKIISKFYKKTISLQELRDLSQTTRAGSSFLSLSDASEESGTGGGGGGHFCMSYDSYSTDCAERFWDHPANPGGYY